MGNRLNIRLAFWLSATLFLSLPTFAAESVLGGSGKHSTKSFVGDACTTEQIKGKLDPSDPKKNIHEEAAKSCFEKVKATDQSCQPSSNPNAQQAQQQANNYTQNTNKQTAASSAAGGMGGGGQSNACGGLGDLMKGMQPPMNKYNEQCSGSREQCKKSCEEKKEESKNACNDITDPAKKAACTSNSELVAQCVGKTAQACQKYEMQTNAILAALANAVMQMMQMQGCQEDTGLDCTKNPADPQCLKDDTPNCTDPKSLANPDVAEKCKCLANNRAPGCPGADSGGLADMAKKAFGTQGGNPLNDPTPATDNSPLTAGSRGAAGGGPGLGGPGGGMPGGGRMASDAGAGGASAAAKAPTGDVLAGDYGGGGGGRGAMGGGYPEIPAGAIGQALRNANLRRDPATANQLTGSNGRSNWQKISERFVDNRSTLLTPN